MKVNIDLRYLILIISTFLSLCLNAQENAIVLDSSIVISRNFNADKISSYQTQRAYNYDKNPKYEQSLIRRLWYSFLQKLRDRIGEKTLSTTWQIIQYLLMFAALALVLNFLLKSNKTSMFKRGDSSPEFDKNLIQSQAGEDDIQTLILQAEKENDYSGAVRYHFLSVLRTLNKEALIEWKDYKTNSQYVHEIKSQTLSKNFEDLSHIFEYVVYGEFELQRQKYEVYKDEFLSFSNQLTAAKV